MIGCFFYSSSINVTIVLKKVTRTSNLYGIRLGFRTVYNIKFSTDIFIIVVVQSLGHGLQPGFRVLHHPLELAQTHIH